MGPAIEIEFVGLFFFQAEDGIRDLTVTGVQTCALPIYPDVMASSVTAPLERQFGQVPGLTQMSSTSSLGSSLITLQFGLEQNIDVEEQQVRSEERRVGKECRSRWSPYH